AKPDIRNARFDNWKKEMKFIASFENGNCKVSGMVTEADWRGWKKDDFTRYLDLVTESFGFKRIMFGSDLQVCNLAAYYQEVLQIVEDYYSGFSSQERADVFGQNALKFYKL